MCIRDRRRVHGDNMSLLAKRTTKEIFRDCLKVVPFMLQEPNKIAVVRRMFIQEFRKNQHETDNEKIEELRQNAVRGLSNYLIFTVKDEYLKNPKPTNIYEPEEDEEIAITYENK
eukprot:TRINITY_DN1625_c0_g1_i5.p3 TRINITY_DN1625_c0_g1~~TRINITY_DN1625_c0_g1_i5.p3  ORF type:complete len:115 (+),score=33.17 TRINITY_DN1625_c0_g1_i5:64-408(+)